MYSSFEELIDKAQNMKNRTKEFASVFYKYNSSQWLGCISEEFTSVRPKTMKDWFDHYTTNVMCLDELYHLCKLIQIQESLTITIDDLFLYFIWEVIINVYNGFVKEYQIMAMLADMGHRCVHSNGTLDRKYGIDFIVDDKFFIQVKPYSFIKGNNNPSLRNDRKLAIIKANKALKDFGKPTYYIFYDKTTQSLIKGKNGKFCHILTDIINLDGTLKQ